MRVVISDAQVIGLYACLKEQEETLDNIVASVYILLQRELYKYLTIDQLQRIDEVHADNVRSGARTQGGQIKASQADNG